MDPEVPGSSPGGGTIIQDDLGRGYYHCAHARYAARAAAALGLTFRTLDGQDGYIFEISRGSRRAVFSAGAGSPYVLNDARAASIARDKHFSALVLERAGLPVVESALFFVTQRWSDRREPGREREDALAFASQKTFPVFCKPVGGSNGVLAECIRDIDELSEYMHRAAAVTFAILIQPYIVAPEYRVLVLEGRPLCFYRKSLPVVVGDGVSTLQQLIEATPRDFGAWPRRVRGRDADGGTVAYDKIVPANQRVTVEGPANRAVGGATHTLSDHVPAALAQLAVAASRSLDLHIAGIDIFDTSTEKNFGALQIIEANYNPMIATLEDHGRWDLIETIWRANIDAALK